MGKYRKSYLIAWSVEVIPRMGENLVNSRVANSTAAKRMVNIISRLGI